MNYRIQPTHIDQIRVGDTVIIDGVLRTVCGRALHRDRCMGTTLWGDSYCLGTVPVAKVVIDNAMLNR
jgi:hypothetical protein